MCWTILNEDEYWERRREELEMPAPGYVQEPERKLLCLDEELEDLESEYGCKLEELGEPDLEEIVYHIEGVYPVSAEYDPNYIAIFYELEAA